MTEAEFASLVQEALFNEAEDTGIDINSHTFEESGLCTMNQGLVVRVGDAEFQLTVVRSR